MITQIRTDLFAPGMFIHDLDCRRLAGKCQGVAGPGCPL